MGPGEIVVWVKMPITRDRTERPRRALLQLGIELWQYMYRIGGRLGSKDVSLCGVTLGIPPLYCRGSNGVRLSRRWTLPGGQFDWGGRLPKSNGGAQRFPQNGWKSFVRVQRQKGA